MNIIVFIAVENPKMAKVVTQETYDEIIKENIIEFSMSVEEAREETIKQLEAQVLFFLPSVESFYVKM